MSVGDADRRAAHKVMVHVRQVILVLIIVALTSSSLLLLLLLLLEFIMEDENEDDTVNRSRSENRDRGNDRWQRLHTL